jgi:hypothetical protein
MSKLNTLLYNPERYKNICDVFEKYESTCAECRLGPALCEFVTETSMFYRASHVTLVQKLDEVLDE